MSFQEIFLFLIVPALVGVFIMSLLLGYGRRLGGGAKTLGWLVAIAIVCAPLLLLFVADFGAMQAEKMAEAPASEEIAEAVVAEPDPVDAAGSAPKRARTASKRKQARPTVSRTVRRRKPDGTTTTTTVTTAAPAPAAAPEALSDAASEPAAAVEREVNEEFDTVDILFGTDRDSVTSGKRLTFGANRAGKLTLGQSSITIPKNHTRGIVERPWEISVVGITLYKQKEDPAKHFTVQDIGILDEAAFVNASNAKLATSRTYSNQAAVFVHGYNNDFDTALYRTAQMVYDMGFDGAPYLYSWPSAAGYSTYEYDQQSARQSIEHLAKFIEIVTQKTNAEKIHLIAHSMGNDVLLEAMRELRFKFGPDHDYKISQVILAAPDVDRNVFERLARQISGMGDGVTLYASANDKALLFSKTYAGGVARAGDVPTDGPVVISGVDTIDVSATQQDFWGVNHNTYAEVSALLQDIKRVLLTGVRPPVNRTPNLEAVPVVPTGTYWRFPPKP